MTYKSKKLESEIMIQHKTYYNSSRTIEAVIDSINYQRNIVTYSKFKLLTGTYLGQKSSNINKFLRYYD